MTRELAATISALLLALTGFYYLFVYVFPWLVGPRGLWVAHGLAA